MVKVDVATDPNGTLVTDTYEVTTVRNLAAFRVSNGKLIKYTTDSFVDRVEFYTEKPAATDLQNGDSVTISENADLSGMVFEKRNGIWKYIYQDYVPRLSAEPSPTAIAAIAAELAVDQKYWFYLFGQEDPDLNGYYFVLTTGTVAGPYSDGGGAASGASIEFGHLRDVELTNPNPVDGSIPVFNLNLGVWKASDSIRGITPQVGWELSNPSPEQRDFNTDLATLQNLADTLGTLINDLHGAGILEEPA